jgi:hypothetical protein
MSEKVLSMPLHIIDLVFDWRTAGRWRASSYDYDLYADEGLGRPQRDPQRYVWRWVCQCCERFYLTPSDTPAQPCPECDALLQRVVGEWDLHRERAPRWWRSTGLGSEEERGT